MAVVNAFPASAASVADSAFHESKDNAFPTLIPNKDEYQDFLPIITNDWHRYVIWIGLVMCLTIVVLFE
jgi:hypothetical protein